MLPTGKLVQEARANWNYSDQSLGVFRDRYLEVDRVASMFYVKVQSLKT